MNLIHFRGLNCHLSAIVNIVASLGINYKDAFCSLWSETEFSVETKHNLYLSKRVLPNLEALGAKIEVLNFKSGELAEKNFSLVQKEELFLVGIDAFYIPWSPFYQYFYEPHYFFAQKENQDSIFCFDSFNGIEMRLKSKDIISHVFELGRIHHIAAVPSQFSLAGEAREVLRNVPKLQENIYTEIYKCKNKDFGIVEPIIKQITAMINNRYLFQHYLNQFAFNKNRPFFDRNFFMKWDAVKHGIYKIYIVQDNESVIEQVLGLFTSLMREETGMAEEIENSRL